MESELRPDHGYTLWSNTKNNFITCLLFRQQNLIGKFNLEAKYEVFTNIGVDLEVTARSKVELNFYSNSFVFWALIEPVTNQYDSLVYLSAVCTLFFLGSVVFFKPKRSVYNLS